jgi:hypothetical protein
MLQLFAFCLDSCIVNKGEKFVHDLGTWELLEGVQSGSAIFGEVFAGRSHGRSNLLEGSHMTRGGLTGLCRRFNRPMQCELGLLFVMHFHVTLLHALVLGEFAYVQGELLFEFLARGLVCFWWFLLFASACFVSDVSSRCPCLRGPRLVLLQVILLFAFLWLSITCCNFSFSSFFSSLFSLVTNHVCCQCTHQGGD